MLLYLHGGGFFACSPLTHRPITTTFARMGFEVFVPDYRKSPEHPFPAGLNDAQAAYHAVRAIVEDERRIVVAGDSAGGGLSASLLLALKNEGTPLPAGVALFSRFKPVRNEERRSTQSIQVSLLNELEMSSSVATTSRILKN